MWLYFKNLSLPIKFGLGAVVLIFILVPLAVYNGEAFGLDHQVLLQLLAPEIFAGLFSLATMSHPGIATIIVVMAIPLAIFVGKAFIVGWVFGLLYDILRKKNLQILFFVIVALAVFFAGSFLVKKSINTTEILKTATTAEDCNKHSESEGYYAPQCFLGLAIKTGDVHVCDALKTKWGAFAAGQCYSAFALNQSRPALCDAIEDSNAKFDCYRSFRQCEKMATASGGDQKSTDSCWITKAGQESNAAYCSNVKEEDRLKECDCTVRHGAFNYSAIYQCEGQ